MREDVKEFEYHGFLGLDKRSDRTIIPKAYQTTAKNVELEKGVYKCRPGYAQWGSLDHSAIAGTFYSHFGIDVGSDQHVLLHKNTELYWGKKTDATYTQVVDVDGSNASVYAEESEFEIRGKSVDSSGNISLKVLLKQQSGCKILEWDGTVWKSKNMGIDETDMGFSVAAIAGGSAEPGLYRCRVSALRIINDVRTSESAPTAGPSNLDYQEVTLTAANAQISLTVVNGSIDDQITHYMLHITKVLVFSGDTEYTTNGHDPTLFYETTPVPKEVPVGITVVDAATVAVHDLTTPIPNLWGYLPIPGHLISKQTGGIVFFAGISEYGNRVYKSGISGYYYHNELYDPFEYYAAGEDDDQNVTGLGLCQDHLVILKEGKTGIVPNHDIDGTLVWRDYKLGCPHRKAFSNISEDQMIVLNQDGIFRLFNGIVYDRQQEIDGQGYHFSEAIRTLSETITPATLEFIFHREKLHIFSGTWGSKVNYSLHPRDGMGWTSWEEIIHSGLFLVDSGITWVFRKDTKLYEQSNLTEVYTDDGDPIEWEITFAVFMSQVSRKDKVLLKLLGVEGDFTEKFFSKVVMDGGAIDTGWQQAFPDPDEVSNIPWFQCDFGANQLHGTYAEISLRGTGQMTIRRLFLGYIEKPMGQLGWSNLAVAQAKPISEGVIILDAGDETRDETDYDIYDAGDETRNESNYDIYRRS